MSLFRWFSKKVAAPAPVEESSGFGNIDATQPYPSGGRSRAKSPQSVPGTAANRKSERLERREMLYAVVRGSMTGAGLLSTSYKFKVLSLDSRGRQYLIMMDMARQNVGDPQRLSDIEIHIAKVAKSRHDILVTAVYWRVNEHVTTGLAHIATVAAAPVVVAAVPAAPASAASRYEPLQQDEVVAFKQALASIPSPAALSAPGEIVSLGAAQPVTTGVQDTELDDRNSPLSGTQYGELN